MIVKLVDEILPSTLLATTGTDYEDIDFEEDLEMVVNCQLFPNKNESKFLIDPDATFIVIKVPADNNVKLEVTSINTVEPLDVQAANVNNAYDEVQVQDGPFYNVKLPILIYIVNGTIYGVIVVNDN